LTVISRVPYEFFFPSPVCLKERERAASEGKRKREREKEREKKRFSR
jgi:hypothetical protein